MARQRYNAQKSTVQAVYSGGMDMREIFISLLVNEVRQGKILSPHL